MPATFGPARCVPAISWWLPRSRASSRRVRNHCLPAVWRYSSGWVFACGSARWSTRRRIAGGRRALRSRPTNHALLRDPEVRAIIAHTGGQATIGYLDLIDLDAIRADPKPIIGYSDISLLHMALYAQTGLVGFHADIATHGFGSDWYTLGDEARRSELIDLYTRVLTKAEAPGALPAREAWETWRPGSAQGPLFGGLLNRLVLLQATPARAGPRTVRGRRVVLGGAAAAGLANLERPAHLAAVRCAGPDRRHGGRHPDRDHSPRGWRTARRATRRGTRCPGPT